MIIGGGGDSTPTPVADFDMPHDGVLITSVGPGSPQSQPPSITTTELSSQRSGQGSRLAGAAATP